MAPRPNDGGKGGDSLPRTPCSTMASTVTRAAIWRPPAFHFRLLLTAWQNALWHFSVCSSLPFVLVHSPPAFCKESENQEQDFGLLVTNVVFNALLCVSDGTHCVPLLKFLLCCLSDTSQRLPEPPSLCTQRPLPLPYDPQHSPSLPG